jgi:hypothetical protein
MMLPAVCYWVVSVRLIQRGGMAAEWQTDRRLKNANEGVGSPAPFGRDTPQTKPVESVCFVCSLRASGAGGIVRERGRFDQTRSRKRSVFTREKLARASVSEGKQGRICFTRYSQGPRIACGFPTDDVFRAYWDFPE